MVEALEPPAGIFKGKMKGCVIPPPSHAGRRAQRSDSPSGRVLAPSHPQAQKPDELFFELTNQISGNLFSLIFALVGIGFIVSFFALIAPRAKESK